MNTKPSNMDNATTTKDDKTAEYPTTYREVKIGNTLYCMTSVFKGEKQLGPTLEKLAAQHVLNEIENSVAELLRA